jgi:hypothetical protein
MGQGRAMMEDMRQHQRIVNESISKHVPEHAWNSTVAIVIAHNNSVHQFGTGILFRIADDSFVVTAAHVIKQAHKHGKSLGISSATDSFISVCNDWLCSSEGQYGALDDPLDVALYHLQQNAVERLVGKAFLRFDDIEFDPQSPTAVYSLFGYPAIWSRPSASNSEPLKLKPLQYTAIAYDRETDTLEGYQERLHLLLDAQLPYVSNQDGSPAVFQDVQGAEMLFPKGLGGISGCSVWRVGDLKVPVANWGNRRTRIVAVQTGTYHANGAIIATRWIAVSTLIHAAFPRLRQAMTLVRPS